VSLRPPRETCSAGGTERLNLRVGDLTVTLLAGCPELRLGVAGATTRFLVEDGSPDARVRATLAVPGEAVPGEKVFDSGSLWQLHRQDGRYLFRFTSHALGPAPYKVADFAPDFSAGEVTLHRAAFAPGRPVYPLEYPLDELLVEHLLVRRSGVEVHGCGLIDRCGEGLLFVGQSGAGKTTTARLWNGRGGMEILSDDRIILRRMDGRFWIYGTPWHGEARFASASRAPLGRVFFLRHGDSNTLTPVSAARAAARLLACSFVPFYDSQALERTLALLEEVAERVPCLELEFVPDSRAVDFLAEPE
jgi:hypothetical protein